jgi:hypothetical protein
MYFEILKLYFHHFDVAVLFVILWFTGEKINMNPREAYTVEAKTLFLG